MIMPYGRLFVYGTLKKGEPNHHWLRPQNGFAKFVDNGTTVKKYPLIIATKYNIPFLIDAPGQGYKVFGEVYEIDEKMLHNIDSLEDHPHFYVRRLEDIYINESINQCWTYFLPKIKPEMLNKEMFEWYSSSGPHNLVYCERYKREPNYNYKNEIMPE
ncbi:putative gamma-glutamylcyclotransferase CG2811 isoform X2 [Rhodnius prolixus]|uniref:Gamma-glutamylcyclotransferase family protein n=3 Tax=Rhodnius TaxID=13248 RepID=R4FLY3_RHOPR